MTTTPSTRGLPATSNDHPSSTTGSKRPSADGHGGGLGDSSKALDERWQTLPLPYRLGLILPPWLSTPASTSPASSVSKASAAGLDKKGRKSGAAAQSGAPSPSPPGSRPQSSSSPSWPPTMPLPPNLQQPPQSHLYASEGYIFCTPPPDRRSLLRQEASSRVGDQGIALSDVEPSFPALRGSRFAGTGGIGSSFLFGAASISNAMASATSEAEGGGAKTDGSKESQQRSRMWEKEDYFLYRRTKSGTLRRYHGYERERAPYWRSYGREDLENDLNMHSIMDAVKDAHGMPVFSPDVVPARVLDVGTGTGAWCLESASAWPHSEFVGLDLVPIQPSLAPLRESDPDLARRVTWVVNNFLEGLPFPDASFDFVHLRFLGDGVPEDRWGPLIEECVRVLRPGATLEFVETNHVFFGSPKEVPSASLNALFAAGPNAPPRSVIMGQIRSGASASSMGLGGDPTTERRSRHPKVIRDGPDYSAVETAYDQVLYRRFINPNAISTIPSQLLLNLTNTNLGTPKHVPILAELSNGYKDGAPMNAEEPIWAHGRGQGRGRDGADTSFVVPDHATLRAILLLNNVRTFSAARELVWEEAEEERRAIQAALASAQVPNASSSSRGVPDPSGSAQRTRQNSLQAGGSSAGGSAHHHHHHHQQSVSGGAEHPHHTAGYLHPFRNRADFERTVDSWVSDVEKKADMASIVSRLLGWREGGEELSVQGRKLAERRRKMSAVSGAGDGAGPGAETAVGGGGSAGGSFTSAAGSAGLPRSMSAGGASFASGTGMDGEDSESAGTDAEGERDGKGGRDQAAPIAGDGADVAGGAQDRSKSRRQYGEEEDEEDEDEDEDFGEYDGEKTGNRDKDAHRKRQASTPGDVTAVLGFQDFVGWMGERPLDG